MKTKLILITLIALAQSRLFCAAAAADSQETQTARTYFSFHLKSKKLTSHTPAVSQEEKKKRRTSKDTLANAMAGVLAEKTHAKTITAFFNTILNGKLPICMPEDGDKISIKFGNRSNHTLRFYPGHEAKSSIALGEEAYYFLTNVQSKEKKVVLTFATRVEEMSPNGEDTTVKALLDKNNNPLQLHVPFMK